MTDQQQEQSVAERIALVQAAQQSGKLETYVPAKAAAATNNKAQPASWGPAMRI